jgi:hypothetical protein
MCPLLHGSWHGAFGDVSSLQRIGLVYQTTDWKNYAFELSLLHSQFGVVAWIILNVPKHCWGLYGKPDEALGASCPYIHLIEFVSAKYRCFSKDILLHTKILWQGAFKSALLAHPEYGDCASTTRCRRPLYRKLLLYMYGTTFLLCGRRPDPVKKSFSTKGKGEDWRGTSALPLSLQGIEDGGKVQRS